MAQKEHPTTVIVALPFAYQDGMDKYDGIMRHLLEPGLYFEGDFGIRVENDYLVTEKGAENLFDYPREMSYFVLT